MHFDLADLRTPSYLWQGTEDLMVPLHHGEWLAEHIPGARLVELEGVDTLPFLGDSAAVIGEVEEFLTGVRHASEPIVLDVVTTEDAPFWQVQSPFAKEGAGGE